MDAGSCTKGKSRQRNDKRVGAFRDGIRVDGPAGN